MLFLNSQSILHARAIWNLLLLFSVSLAISGCLNSSSNTAVATNPEEGPLSNFDVNLYSLNKIVCDPFHGDLQPGPNDGLIAQIYYRGANQPQWTDTQSYITQGTLSGQTLFFSTLEVPTRMFDLGFPTQTGSNIKNDSNESLIEYFGIQFSSILKLSSLDEEGTYELALLSDDGATFKVRQPDGTYKTLVSNDNNHPTRFGCGDRIEMTRDTELFVQMDYYQGPRYHISMIPMWRKVTATTPKDSRCGQSGNTLFFDPNNNSAPQPAYNDLLSRGWKPIAADNWNLPAFAILNPCTSGTTPTISHFRIVENIEGVVTFAWETNIPATSQILIKNPITGEETLTVADNRLRGQHQMSIYGNVNVGSSYDFQAVSISADYGKAISPAIRWTVK